MCIGSKIRRLWLRANDQLIVEFCTRTMRKALPLPLFLQDTGVALSRKLELTAFARNKHSLETTRAASTHLCGPPHEVDGSPTNVCDILYDPDDHSTRHGGEKLFQEIRVE